MRVTDLKPCDILNSISDPKFPIHWPVATGTDSPFVHSAAYEGDGIAISALADGIQRRTPDQWDRFMLVTRYPHPLTAQRVLARVKAMVGLPYDFLGIAIDAIEAVSGLDLPDPEQKSAFICSSLISRAFRDESIIVAPGYRDEDVTPGVLAERSILEVVGYIRLR